MVEKDIVRLKTKQNVVIKNQNVVVTIENQKDVKIYYNNINIIYIIYISVGSANQTKSIPAIINPIAINVI